MVRTAPTAANSAIAAADGVGDDRGDSGAGAVSSSGSRSDHTGASTSSVIPSKLALSLFSIFAFLEGHAAISQIVLTFASDVRLKIGRRTYTCSELVRVRTLAKFEVGEHV